VVSPYLSALVSEISSQWQLANPVVSLRFGAQSGHAVEGYRVARIGGSSGIGRDVHQCVSYKSQSRKSLERSGVTYLM
jgi:hypothetical protein